MRHIVLIVGTLTGGPIAGGSILVVLNIYRLLLGGRCFPISYRFCSSIYCSTINI